jgi:DNA-binding transcriptional MerR regulator
VAEASAPYRASYDQAESADEDSARRRGKSASAFRTISEVAGELDVPQHVLRFWETKFPQVRPLKRGGGRRYYRPEDIELLRRIRELLYTEGYTIKGVQRLMRENGVRAVINGPEAEAAPGAAEAAEAGARRLGGGERAELEAILSELTALRDLLGSSRH